MLIGLGDSLIDSLVAGTAAAPPAGSPAANALVGSTPSTTRYVAPARTGPVYATVDAVGNVVPVAAVVTNTPVPAPSSTLILEAQAASAYPLGLSGTQWLMILGGVAVLAYFLLIRKGGSK